MDAGWLNIGSLLFGLFAWGLPGFELMREKISGKRRMAVIVASFSACAIALCFQLYYNYYLVRVEDWSALMDTMLAVIYAASVLSVITIFLNTMLVVKYRE